MNNICIVGFMCSGKTTVSKCLSSILGRKLIDTDEEIEKREKKTINDIFSEFGEEYFRKVETEVLSESLKVSGAIISTGGGMAISKYNRNLMKKNGYIVALTPDFSVISDRIENSKSTRPLLKDSISKIELRFNERLPFYLDSDIQIHTENNLTPTYYAYRIIEKINEMST